LPGSAGSRSCVKYFFPVPGKSGSFRLKTVLIADDNASGRELLRTVLEACDYRVVEAADGEQAIRQARESRPDLILLDLRMPDRDGFAVLRQLRGEVDFAATPIVALTASATAEDRARVVAAGFTGFLTKPIRLPDLRGEVARLLR